MELGSREGGKEGGRGREKVGKSVSRDDSLDHLLIAMIEDIKSR